MRAVFLVGVNHQYQIGPDIDPAVEASAEDFSKFEGFLQTVIERYNIKGIAEEMSLCALRKWRVRGDSFPCRVAEDMGKPHRYCDPDAAAQKASNMTNSQRQQYWIQKLISFDTFPVLFILGADEVESFEGLLTEAAFQPFVVERNWQPDKHGE
jgi:hypothetical protein